MTITDEFVRVTRAHPCVICGRPDWCLSDREESPAKAICAREPSPRRWGGAGWMHILRDDHTPRRPRVYTVENDPDFGDLARRYQEQVNERDARHFAYSLGLSYESLVLLGLGRSSNCWIFPMSGSRGICGIRTRFPDGSKRAIKGSKQGLFIPNDRDPGRTVVFTEGPTDCAALLDVSLDAIGRPSCHGGARVAQEIIRRDKPAEAIVFADRDDAGRQGAEQFLSHVELCVPRAKIIFPPEGIKDVRAWRQAGATREDILALIGEMAL